MANSTGGEDVVKPQQQQQQKKKWYPTLTILSKEKPPVPKERTVCPEYNAGFLSTLTFQWTAPLLAVSTLYQRSNRDGVKISILTIWTGWLETSY